MIQTIFHWHSFVEIFNYDFSILIDPFITWNPLCDISIDQICSKNIRAIILTHGHSDHIGDCVEIFWKTGCLIIAEYELTRYLSKVKSVTNLHPMHIWGQFIFDWFVVKYLNAVHWTWIAELWNWWSCPSASVLIRIGWKNIYHAGDTGLHYDMKLLWKYEKIDIAFLPIWDNFTMWNSDAVIATWFIKPKIVVPIHYNTFEYIKADVVDFSRMVMQDGVSIPKPLMPWQYIILE